MFEIVYASAARKLFNPLDLAKMLEAARRNNALIGVSGILLYEEGSFLQVLEGDEAVVKALFARISADDRHGRVVVLRQGTIEEPRFSKWTMGFVSLDAQLRSAFPEGHSLRSNGSLRDASSSLVEVLDMFRSGRWHNYVLG